ncbi:MAG: aminotransferase class I/II-fold pyridoxal phosphate-dependent enzyme [Parachlamydiales bacterium]|nr:aminotransferase class I/II-fold pyridoxal phosphate-dependent enzyme [Verrucomicrobiota bacterium]MBX3719209.1 aminotransferase class I/II-fold pyridoxal phosphate-dependent enzyme [Candidatus Acheromyda pituitae]
MKFAFLEQLPQSPATAHEPIVPIDGTHLLWKEKKMLHFCGQDTLGLSQQNDLKKNAMKYLLQFGIGTTIFNHPRECLPCQQQLQDRLAGMLGMTQTFFLPSRFTGLSILISRLTQPNSLVFVDEGCHPLLLEIIDSKKTQVVRFNHNDPVHLEELLKTTAHLDPFSKVIFTESLFASSGDIAALEEIILIAQNSQSILIVDDSLGFGMKGDDGLGLAAQRGGIDCIIASFAQSCGIPAAFIACNKELSDYLMGAYPYWQEHPVSIPTLGTIDAALEWIPQMEGERRQLEHRCHWLLLQLNKLGFPVHRSHGHVITLSYQEEEEAASIWQSLIEREILCEMISEPSSGAVRCKLRFTVNVLHTPEDLNRLYQALQICVKDAAQTIAVQHP